jgi:DNA-binding NarL/FixJ family response regulator
LYCGGAILIADGDDNSRTSVASLLERFGYLTSEATTGYEALDLAAQTRPLLVLLDVELTGVSGYEVCRELRERHGNELPLVLLSATRVASIDRIAGLLLGADDYVVKPFEPDELLARVRSLLRRHEDTSRPGDGRSAGAAELDDLTVREREVLNLLAEGLSQDEIGRELFITPKTVATHIQRVLSKLGVHSRAQAVAVVLGNDRSSSTDVALHALYPEIERV